MERGDFHYFPGLLNKPLINRKTDCEGNKINWGELRWIRYGKGKKIAISQDKIFEK